MELLYCVLIAAVVAVKSDVGISGGYAYPPPEPPFQFDEPSSPDTPVFLPSPPLQDEPPLPPPQVVPTYLPPSVVYPPIGSPPLQDEILPPIGDTIIIPSPPTNQYLPPVNQYLPPASTKQAQVNVLNMSCLNARDSAGYFRTLVRFPTASSRTFPVLEAAPNDCVITPQSSDIFRIDLDGLRMNECGVRTCGARMCLTVRMATVQGLRLAEDNLVTLQCVPQEAVVSHTKHIRVNTNSLQSRAGARSIAVAAGGSQRRFDMQLNLFRRSSGSNSFDQPLEQGSAVRLGDELMLRAVIRDGDGWRYSRMGSVMVRSAASQRSVALVDEDGCRNPSMRSISPQQPLQVSPLIVQLPFRAFLFQGAAPADDLLLSVRMLGCLRARDCSQARICDDSQQLTRNRISRAASNFSNDQEIDAVTGWESQLEFRVLPRDFTATTTNSGSFNPLITTCMIGILIALLSVIVILIRIKGNRYN